MKSDIILPTIPEYITVHLGAPSENARNVTLSFADYIKNVASSEIYPTWPESALRANILAQISFALNRVFTEYYRSRGYDFDITNSTSIDQSFVYGRDIFENISRIVDELFNDLLSLSLPSTATVLKSSAADCHSGARSLSPMRDIQHTRSCSISTVTILI